MRYLAIIVAIAALLAQYMLTGTLRRIALAAAAGGSLLLVFRDW